MTTTLNLDEQLAARQPESPPSYDRGATDSPLLAETIGDNLDRTVAAHGDRDALVEYATGRRFTYAQLRAEVDALAHGLLRRGIAKGDRVGIWAPNCAEWIAAAVRHGQDRRHPGLHQPGLPDPRAAVRARSRRASACWSPPGRSRPPTTRR